MVRNPSLGSLTGCLKFIQTPQREPYVPCDRESRSLSGNPYGSEPLSGFPGPDSEIFPFCRCPCPRPTSRHPILPTSGHYIVTPAVIRPSRLNSNHNLGWHNRALKKVCPVGFLDLENPPGSPVLGFPLGRAGDGFVACIAFGIHRHHGFRLRQSRVYRDRRWH